MLGESITRIASTNQNGRHVKMSKTNDARRVLTETSKIEQEINQTLHPVPSLDDILQGACRHCEDSGIEMRVAANDFDWEVHRLFARQWHVIPIRRREVGNSESMHYAENRVMFPDLYPGTEEQEQEDAHYREMETARLSEATSIDLEALEESD